MNSRSFIVTLVTVGIAKLPLTDGECKTLLGSNGGYYDLCLFPTGNYMSWQDARDMCLKNASTLVDVANETVSTALKDFLSKSILASVNVWIGVTTSNATTFHFVNNRQTSVTYIVANQDAAAANRFASLKLENNVLQYFANPFYIPLPFICQYPVSDSRCNGFFQRDSSCYRLNETALSWFEASNACLRNGGNLAEFADLASASDGNNALAQLVNGLTSKEYWIGLVKTWWIRSDVNDATMLADVQYSMWLQDEITRIVPNDSKLCVCMGKDGFWSPGSCNLQNGRAFVCQTVQSPSTTTTMATMTTTTTLSAATPSTSAASTKTQTDFPTSTVTAPTSTLIGPTPPAGSTSSVTISSTSLSSSTQSTTASAAQNGGSGLSEGGKIGLGVGLGVGIPLIIVLIVIAVLLYCLLNKCPSCHHLARRKVIKLNGACRSCSVKIHPPAVQTTSGDKRIPLPSVPKTDPDNSRANDVDGKKQGKAPVRPSFNRAMSRSYNNLTDYHENPYSAQNNFYKSYREQSNHYNPTPRTNRRFNDSEPVRLCSLCKRPVDSVIRLPGGFDCCVPCFNDLGRQLYVQHDYDMPDGANFNEASSRSKCAKCGRLPLQCLPLPGGQVYCKNCYRELGMISSNVSDVYSSIGDAEPSRPPSIGSDASESSPPSEGFDVPDSYAHPASRQTGSHQDLRSQAPRFGVPLIVVENANTVDHGYRGNTVRPASSAMELHNIHRSDLGRDSNRLDPTMGRSERGRSSGRSATGVEGDRNGSRARSREVNRLKAESGGHTTRSLSPVNRVKMPKPHRPFNPTAARSSVAAVDAGTVELVGVRQKTDEKMVSAV